MILWLLRLHLDEKLAKMQQKTAGRQRDSLATEVLGPAHWPTMKRVDR